MSFAAEPFYALRVSLERHGFRLARIGSAWEIRRVETIARHAHVREITEAARALLQQLNDGKAQQGN